MADTNLPDVNKYDDPKLYEDITGGLPSIGGKLQGTRPEDYDTYAKQTKEILDKLEHRYDEPNWWKVAAGFAKPQLGGFLASAGSAAQAMGENTELKRAQELPIARARAQLGLQGILGARSKDQQTKWNSFNESDLKNPMKLKDIIAEGPDTDIGKAASRLLQDINTSLHNVNTNISNATAAQEGANKNPQLFENLSRIAQDSASLNSTDEEKQKRIKDRNDLLNNNIPPQTDKQVWQTLSADEKIKRIQDYNKAKQDEGLTDLQKTKNLAVSDSQDLPVLRSIRNLSLGVGIPDRQILNKDGKTVVQTGQQQMAELLGKFSTADILDLIGKGADEGRLGEKFKGIRDLFTQGNFSPEAQPAFENLVKQLARLQVDTRNGSVNPTDTFSNLLGKGSPNTSMSQNGFVRVIDTMAHDKKRNLETYEYLASHPEVKTTDLHFDPKFKKTLDQMDEERSNISTHSPNASLPWYYNRSGNREEQKVTNKNTNTQTSANPPKSGHGQVYRQFRKDPKDPKSPIVWYEDKDGHGWAP